MPIRLDEINFFDPALQESPYEAYETLREEAPVWKDPLTGFYVITRYEDVRSLLVDKARVSNEVHTESAANHMDAEEGTELAELARHAREVHELFEQGGVVPGPPLSALDPPKHRALRLLMEHAFRPARVKELEPYVEGLANQLIDDFIETGTCDYMQQFSVLLPLHVIGRQTGVPDEDLPRIKAWTDAWMRRLSLMQTPEEHIQTVKSEIEAQQYFRGIFERVRDKPDGSLISDVVNTEMPELGRTINDSELMGMTIADIFVGGAETSSNALGHGMIALVEDPELVERIASDPERYVPIFAEEVLRLEAPIQGLLRRAKVELTVSGVTIPEGGVMNLRYAAANRDPRRFADPTKIDLDRDRPTSHLTFSTGAHHCLGAPLARRELYYGLKATVERMTDFRFAGGVKDVKHRPTFFNRILPELQIEFRARG